MTASDKKHTLKEDLLYFILKAGIFLILLSIFFLYIFGICRCTDNMMSPSFQDGDLAIYDRLDKDFSPGEIVVLETEGKLQIRRIVAIPGDCIEITADGLKINGYLQQEDRIFFETLPYKEGISFPVTLKEGEYFVLGDHRSNARDSRIYGAVTRQNIKGSVISLLRHRGF